MIVAASTEWLFAGGAATGAVAVAAALLCVRRHPSPPVRRLRRIREPIEPVRHTHAWSKSPRRGHLSRPPPVPLGPVVRGPIGPRPPLARRAAARRPPPPPTMHGGTVVIDLRDGGAGPAADMTVDLTDEGTLDRAGHQVAEAAAAMPADPWG